MLDGNGGQELVRGGVDLFSREESMRCGREVTGALTGSTGILNGKREQDSKLVLGCKENFGESISQRTPIEEVVPDELAAETGYTSLPIATEGQVNGAGNTQTIVAAPRGNATSGWVWPTWGEIAREFAPTEAGGHGIDIAGIPGQEIHAASGGTVAYAGRDLSGGDGKLIIIRHHSGLMSTYSHARQLFVAEDDVVRAGDVIASLGANAQNESVLRFEVRQDGNPLNPMNFLSN